ncbi:MULTISPECIES: FAD-dependent oxidoreductase [unclassified Streptomyces]|uniref:NAD(P)/FAD-dependent oxidoreductase n=1 Tax=unclassified Streptomyces TaxID=2593676 RepID=UPI002DD8CFC4|nr:FAD-dependent oxidoreductase [Streptomyces sp. NBC_01775]WSB75618.1 FAD-binding oxidoreductase [Streptomyces sp. NBC_01775]WSS44916.1 FAD-binding oxidoreductase [Streptomyces sp. NBC_01187]
MRVIVIGTGVVGAAAGYELARSGVDTVLVDAVREGGATSAGAGIICPWSSRMTDPDYYRMAVAGAEHYPGLLETLAEDGETEVGHRRVGALRLLFPEEAESVHSSVTARAAASAPAGEVSLIDGAEAAALFPPLRHEGPVLHVTGGARLDGRLLREALRRGAVRHGARLVEAEARIEAGGERVRAVHADGERLAADAVIDAAGAWSAGLLEPLGVRLPVAPQRGQLVHLRLPGTDTSRWPVLLPPTSHYLLAFDDSRVVVGATREEGSGFDHRVTAAGLAEVLNEALAVAPGLAGATHLETRVGFRPTGPDPLPLLGTVPGLRGLVIANGLGSSGLTMGPYAGSLAARLALGAEPGMDLRAYDPLR